MFGIPLDCPFSSEDGATAISWWVASRPPISVCTNIVAELLMVVIVESWTIAILPDRAAYVAKFGFAYATRKVNFVQ